MSQAPKQVPEKLVPQTETQRHPLAVLAEYIEANAALLNLQYRTWAGHLHKPAAAVIDKAAEFAAAVKAQAAPSHVEKSDV